MFESRPRAGLVSLGLCQGPSPSAALCQAEPPLPRQLNGYVIPVEWSMGDAPRQVPAWSRCWYLVFIMPQSRFLEVKGFCVLSTY